MSAFDLTGAIVWTGIWMILFSEAMHRADDHSPEAKAWFASRAWPFVISLFGSVFCLARLAGAHL